MRKIYICFIVYILVLTIAGCENYDKAIQGIGKGEEFVDTAAKKVTETREGVEQSIGKVLGKDTGKSDAEKSESKENNENKKKEKD
ncbi:MAG: hypothetical protein MUO31_02525 [Thermodesulfovibrionales bacterium]|nr:hypothetical protein [Thermodesulfovibrionales bacterium]